MDLKEAIERRHSVRSYTDAPIPEATLAQIRACIDECNKAGGLHIQLVLNEEKAFGGFKAHYGKFSGVRNYLALVGKKGKEEAIGYYGEKIVLLAQTLGLSSCWVALTFSKVASAFRMEKGEKLYIVIPLGYGTTQGSAHKSKAAQAVSNATEQSPAWFTAGVNAALLAPTAMNQQKFFFALSDDAKTVSVKAGFGPCTKIDAGIAKCHFEIGAGKENVVWAK